MEREGKEEKRREEREEKRKERREEKREKRKKSYELELYLCDESHRNHGI